MHTSLTVNMRVLFALVFVACLALVLADSDDSQYREERNYRGSGVVRPVPHGGGRPYQQPGYPGGRPGGYPGVRPGGYPGGVHGGGGGGGGSRYPQYHG
ncbi:hypothetical protein B566_EDAN009175 [Ephemera danica]|nr:hypothetical protein B566_EDAN009175 [Ephemera danica]